MRIGWLGRLLAPNYGCCGRCGTPWLFEKPHCTFHSAKRGCFPLCEKCWAELSIEDRVPYYWDLWLSWTFPKPDWELIKKAVERGG